MSLFFKKGQLPPKREPTDTVLPVPSWDDQGPMRDSCLHITYRFDDVLDPEALRRSLERLLQFDGWRTLGARLRRKDDGKLEYHLPAQYDVKRPAFSYTVVKHSMRIKEHPLAAGFPEATGQPSLLGDPTELAAVCVSADCPKRIEDWLYSDRPQLVIDVVAFSDATLLTITFMHTLMDAMGLASFLKAWTAVMNGQEEQVPAFQHIDEDPPARFNNRTPADAYVNKSFMLTGLRRLVFIACYIFELVWYRSDKQRMICIPGQYVDEMRDQALQELAEQNKDQPAPFLSESDVLLAWWVKALIRALNPSPGRMVSLLNVFDIRATALQESPSANTNTAFITNAALVAMTFLRTHQILREPVSFVASHIRRALVQQRTLPLIEAFFALNKDASDKNPAVFGEATSLLVCCTNWHRGRFFQGDFSSAVITPGIPLNERVHPLGRPSCVSPTQHWAGPALRNVAAIIGKDAAGNWWLSCNLRTSAWSVMEKELNALGSRKSL